MPRPRNLDDRLRFNGSQRSVYHSIGHDVNREVEWPRDGTELETNVGIRLLEFFDEKLPSSC